MSNRLTLRVPRRSQSSRVKVASRTVSSGRAMRLPARCPSPMEVLERKECVIPTPVVFQADARQLEQKLAEAFQSLAEALVFTSLRESPMMDIEWDIWVQLPPKHEFTLQGEVKFLGRAKPDPLPAELMDEEM